MAKTTMHRTAGPTGEAPKIGLANVPGFEAMPNRSSVKGVNLKPHAQPGDAAADLAGQADGGND